MAITGANESSQVANAGFNSVGNYTVDVSNYAGSVESAAVTLNVVQSVTIESQPESGEISEGESRSLSVVAVGSSPISYQWKLNGAAIVVRILPLWLLIMHRDQMLDHTLWIYKSCWYQNK